MRRWAKGFSMKQAHDQFGLYEHGIWNKQMDRQWESDDGYSVSSRLLRTAWGKVEHVAINKRGPLTANGEKDIPWKIKMEIKNELFGEERPAIEIFPARKRLIDTCDVYHLWVFEKGFEFPFGIHPQDETTPAVNRGYSFTQDDAQELQSALGEKQ